jgi:thermitase
MNLRIALALVASGPFFTWTSLNADVQTITPAASRPSPSRELIVAVIDTGVDTEHPDLKSHLWVNIGETGLDSKGRDKSKNQIDDDKNGFIDDVHGWNFASNSPALADHHGHGTHIAGLIHSVAPNTRLMILKYYGSAKEGGNHLLNTISAIRYATKMHADIINYSGGGRDFNSAEFAALLDAEKKGILIVAAAGNDGANTDEVGFYPASYPLENIVAVTAIDPKSKVLKSSNFGVRSVDLAAPGENVVAPLPGGRQGPMTGTSQATALVAGAAALLAEQNKSRWPAAVIKETLLASGDWLTGLQTKTQSSRKLNAQRALLMKPQSVNAFNFVETNTLDDRDLFRHRTGSERGPNPFPTKVNSP